MEAARVPGLAGVATVIDLDDVVADGGSVLRDAWRSVSAPDVAARCAAASADLRAGGGAARAADLLEAELPVDTDVWATDPTGT